MKAAQNPQPLQPVRLGQYVLIYNTRLNIFCISLTKTFVNRQAPRGMIIRYGTFDECLELLS